MAAAVVAITAALQLVERDWLRGANGLAVAAALALIAAGVPERSTAGKRLSYAFLVGALILSGIRLLSS